MRQRLYGSLLLVVLATLLDGCRTSQPPKISIICLGDGFGGADCATATGLKVYKKPSELKDFWMTTEVDEANFSAWCYDTSKANIAPAMEKIKGQAKQGPL